MNDPKLDRLKMLSSLMFKEGRKSFYDEFVSRLGDKNKSAKRTADETLLNDDGDISVQAAFDRMLLISEIVK